MARRPVQYRGKFWALTYFPNEEQTIQGFEELIKRTKEIEYAIVGEEYAPETGKRHFQGYIELKDRKRLGEIKTMLGIETIHLEPARGTKEQNIEYCTKPNESGYPEKVIVQVSYQKEKKTLNNRRSRDKNEEMRLFLNDLRTKTLEYIEDEYPVRYYREMPLILKYRLDKEQGSDVWDGDLKTKNFWIWGKTGTGKSTWARRQLKEPGDRRNYNIFYKAINKWWDGYGDQRVVLIEDWNPGENGSLSKALLQYVKVWADRFTFNAEIKGGTRAVFPGRYFLIITSNHSIDESFQGISSEDVDAIKRRFKEQEIMGLDDIFLTSDLDPNILSDPIYND